ncbi:hypothetical protein BZZ08_03439 [Streptomyces sp. MH60]|nr:hypothetical protein BZZ08_03439 [Streptomyces sp. MH60]
METIPTAEDIKARRTVRFAAGHLSAHADWTGTLVGYSTLYDTVHVCVDAPGNSESGSKITYSRKDVEWCEPAPAEEESASVGRRETVLRVADEERIVRTELGGRVRTVKQLETAHTKAVKAALVEMRRANLANLHRKADELKRARWYPLRDLDVTEVKNSIRRAERGTFPTHGTPGASTAPFPRVKFTDEIPAYLVEIEPGHYATEEAAESLALF